MSYDEHLISQAGGDGDVLDQIQRRADKTREHHATGNSFPLDADKDRDTLLALVREQRARIERVRALVKPTSRSGRITVILPGDVLTALEPTP